MIVIPPTVKHVDTNTYCSVLFFFSTKGTSRCKPLDFFPEMKQMGPLQNRCQCRPHSVFRNKYIVLHYYGKMFLSPQDDGITMTRLKETCSKMFMLYLSKKSKPDHPQYATSRQSAFTSPEMLIHQCLNDCRVQLLLSSKNNVHGSPLPTPTFYCDDWYPNNYILD